ncbi:MAG: hypothetical protein HY701_04305, partial [Gemmatimonadetes bacterium]|nr:hypothetical protein [Gemmatimonadota bacterium]
MLRLTGSEQAVAEIVAVAEHVASLTAAAAAFQLRPDVGVDSGGVAGEPLVVLVDENGAGDSAGLLAEIRAWARGALGVDRVPAVWRALANYHRLLEATWHKDRLIMDTGTLDELTKGCAALAVA